MKFWLQFLVYAVLLNIIGWFIAEGALWLSLVLKPHTEWGMIVERFVVHIVFIIFCTYLAFTGAEE